MFGSQRETKQVFFSLLVSTRCCLTSKCANCVWTCGCHRSLLRDLTPAHAWAPNNRHISILHMTFVCYTLRYNRNQTNRIIFNAWRIWNAASEAVSFFVVVSASSLTGTIPSSLCMCCVLAPRQNKLLLLRALHNSCKSIKNYICTCECLSVYK